MCVLGELTIDELGGKSHLFIGLGLAACEQGRRVHVTTAQLVNESVEAADDRVVTARNAAKRVHFRSCSA